MKAVAVLPAERAVRVIDHPAPGSPSASHVLLRTLEVGICGTDREICSFQYGTPPAGSPYLVLGHECLAEVVAAGPQAAGFRPGDLAVPMVRRPCSRPDCAACRSGRQDFCYTGEFTERGINGAHGFLAERIAVDARHLVPVPAGLREVAVLAEPLTIAEKGLAEVRRVQSRLPWLSGDPDRWGEGRRAVVLGAGPVGLLGALALAADGFEVFVYSRGDGTAERADVVKALGGTYVPAETSSMVALKSLVGRIDLVYEASGASAAAFELLKELGVNGVFVFTGVPGRKEPVPVDTSLLMRNLVLQNQLVFGTVNAGREAYEAAVKDLAVFRTRWPKALASLISGRHPMEEFPALATGRPPGIKHVIAVG